LEHEITHKTREGWLDELVDMMRPEFEAAGVPLPVVKTSAGFPPRGGLGEKKKTRGCCMYGSDGSAHVFLNPTEDIPVDIFGVLRHELVHAALGKDESEKNGGHGQKFKALGLKVGLEGKPTEMFPKLEVLDRFNSHMLPKLGWYPHIKLEPNRQKKKQTTRMLKIVCDGTERHDDGTLNTALAHDEYVLRGSKTQLDRGVPDCPVCGLEMVDEKPPQETEDG
jgi:hypothetical protein